MDETARILQEQLRFKDKQIEQLQRIIENLTKDEEEPSAEEEPEPHIPSFWERNTKLSYAVLCLVVTFGIFALISPWCWKSLWDSIGGGGTIMYVFTLTGIAALIFICWLNTPRGRNWLIHL